MTAEGDTFTPTAGQATQRRRYDVKALGRDQQKLTAYVESLDD
ncbi:hypothetical protein [Terrabacter sp. MAHUQ-38]|nr:hypothetical protein [Terrabacter sp. MAHUQ-38]